MKHLARTMLFGATLGGLILLGGANQAKADLIPEFEGATAVAGGFEYTYRLDLTANQEIRAGDFFTIYDFLGFVVGSANEPGDWTFTSMDVGLTPPLSAGDPGVLVDDDPGVPNLTWTFNGPTTVTGPTSGVNFFTAVSTLPPGGLDFYAGRGTRATGAAAGTKTANAGLVVVPIPEPISMALLGLGGVAAFGIFRRRQNAVQA